MSGEALLPFDINWLDRLQRDHLLKINETEEILSQELIELLKREDTVKLSDGSVEVPILVFNRLVGARTYHGRGYCPKMPLQDQNNCRG